jgi:rhamnulokinase
MRSLAALDLGNESGRVMRVQFDSGRLSVDEIYRFANYPVTIRGTLYWDVLRLWHELAHGLAQMLTERLDGIAVDSFGVDFGLLDARGQLIGNPVHMRDVRTTGMMEWVLERIPRETLFQRSGGIGFYTINTLYQLVAILQQQPWQLEQAATLLTMPNLMNYWLTGEKLSEFTHSTTTQCYNPLAGAWDDATLEVLGIPVTMFPPVVQPGARIGSYEGVPVFAVASHDTGSAVVAVPTETPHYAYISSGTWSLVGIETRQPLLSTAALEANLTSEGGAFGTFRPLKLVMGMWLIQQCRAVWAGQGMDTDYATVFAAAETAEPFAAWINPDDPRFFPPGDMPARIRLFCQETGQPLPQSSGAVVRCILESLAFTYRVVIEQLIAVSGQPVDVIHIVGGGAQNPLLCQMTANATGRLVLAGPVEATALGNGLVQLIALGELSNLAEARAVVRRSFAPQRYEPQHRADWDAAFARFRQVMPAL